METGYSIENISEFSIVKICCKHGLEIMLSMRNNLVTISNPIPNIILKMRDSIIFFFYWRLRCGKISY